jgi:hypothetical protein
MPVMASLKSLLQLLDSLFQRNRLIRHHNIEGFSSVDAGVVYCDYVHSYSFAQNIIKATPATATTTRVPIITIPIVSLLVVHSE